MELCYEGKIEGTSHVAKLEKFGAIYKVFISGLMDVDKQDRVLGLRINNNNSGYQSYSHQNGDHREGRSDTTGFVLGRTGWNLSAIVGIEYTLFRTIGITGIGHTTFFHQKDVGVTGLFFNSDCRGIYRPLVGVSDITFYTTGGFFSGEMKVYAL